MATRVTGPNSTTPEVPPAATPAFRDTGGTLVNHIGPGQLDNPRIAARQATYRNTVEEQAVVAAYDRAAYDRVRRMEQHYVDDAERAVSDITSATLPSGRPGLIASADEVTAELYDIVTELERGASASDLAERFKALQNQAKQETLPKLGRAAAALEGSHLPRLEDPYAAVQNTIAKMPHSSFHPLDPTKYLD